MKKLYKLEPHIRKKLIQDHFNDLPHSYLISRDICLDDSVGDNLVENFFNYFQLPMGIVNGIPINKKLKTAVLGVEESSVIAALNNASKLFRNIGFIKTVNNPASLIGQIVYKRNEFNGFELLDHQEEIRIFLSNEFKSYFKRGGKLLSIDRIDSDNFVTYHFVINPLEAMGANLVTQICERSSNFLTTNFSLPSPLMCILSNSSNAPVIRVEARLKVGKGYYDKVSAQRIADASKFAHEESFRASTHNKGILNAIDPILLVTGNDWRANSALLHSFASRSGIYSPLSRWFLSEDTAQLELVGELEIPMQLGIVGGATKIHPIAQLCLEMMEIKEKKDLIEIIAVCGLLQNFSALKALVGEGIIAGHMKMHTKNISLELTKDIEIQEKLTSMLNERLKKKKKITLSDGKELLKKIFEIQTKS